ncbi:MAG TPA: HAD family hydrolase [Candidatus Dormibacteraeota bacterium]|nr:HAD family hydrolase [Candidatus Dormibacteraeota bacterium]
MGADLPEGARLTAAAAAPFHPDTVVLDVDGVLVDVGPSFREAVRHTVATVQRLMGLERVWTPSQAEIADLKRAGGFNDDIHSSIALAAVGAGGAATRLPALLTAVEAAGGGLAGLRAVAPDLPRVDGALCVRIFDEHYWGAVRFRAVFGEEPRHVIAAAGLVEAERPLVGADLPRRLRETAAVRRVALITGRHPAELDAALDLLGWSPADLDAVVTGDHLRKPDPACLDRVLGACGSSAAVYAGDVRDDWELVRRHRAERPGGPAVRGVIVGGEAEALRPLGVDVTLRDAGDLVPLLRWWAAGARAQPM